MNFLEANLFLEKRNMKLIYKKGTSVSHTSTSRSNVEVMINYYIYEKFRLQTNTFHQGFEPKLFVFYHNLI